MRCELPFLPGERCGSFDYAFGTRQPPGGQRASRKEAAALKDGVGANAAFAANGRLPTVGFWVLRFKG